MINLNRNKIKKELKEMRQKKYIVILRLINKIIYILKHTFVFWLLCDNRSYTYIIIVKIEHVLEYEVTYIISANKLNSTIYHYNKTTIEYNWNV